MIGDEDGTFKNVEDLEAKTNVKHGDFVICTYTAGNPINEDLYDILRFATGIYTPMEDSSHPYKLSIDISANPKHVFRNSSSTIYIYQVGSSFIKEHKPDIKWGDQIISEQRNCEMIQIFHVKDMKILMPAEEFTQYVLQSRNLI